VQYNTTSKEITYDDVLLNIVNVSSMQGNFSSIEKGGTGGLFASEATEEEG
jgi:hypothetical protein